MVSEAISMTATERLPKGPSVVISPAVEVPITSASLLTERTPASILSWSYSTDENTIATSAVASLSLSNASWHAFAPTTYGSLPESEPTLALTDIDTVKYIPAIDAISLMHT